MEFTKQYDPFTTVSNSTNSSSTSSSNSSSNVNAAGKTITISKLRARYPSLEPAGVGLLERLLDLDPNTRVTAEQALKDLYFIAGPVAEPHE
jgi:hypothetical protein